MAFLGPMRVEKAWGHELILVNNELYCAKLLILKPNWQCSLHYHSQKDETFYLLKGQCTLEFGNSQRILHPGDQQRIAPATKHRFSTTSGATILEVSTHHSDSDVTRLEPSKPLTPPAECA